MDLNLAVSSASLIEKCCLIASPVAGNPTHYIIEQAFAHRGLDWRFMTFEVDPAQLGDAIRGIRALGFRGVKVGEPFQESVCELLDDLTDRARRCGSVNCITAEGQRLIGDNTEGAALVDLFRQYVNPSGVTALLLGTGRLARAIAVALAEAGVAEVQVVGRSEEAAKQVVDVIPSGGATSAAYKLLTVPPLAIDTDVALIVNATSMGTDDPRAQLPLDLAALDPRVVVADVSYHSARTWLTRAGAERGCRVVEGVELYVEQTAAAIRAWTGDTPDTAAMREAAEEFLGI
jgi:shikimate dehydrogenase